MLVDLVDLSLIGKQLHWSVVGRDFRPLHELVGSWRELGDTVAERAVAIGYYPDGRAHTVATTGQLEPVERGPIGDADVARMLTHRLSEAVERARERMDRLGELDAASQDGVIEVVRAIEEQLWTVRAQLPHGGGPTDAVGHARTHLHPGGPEPAHRDHLVKPVASDLRSIPADLLGR